MAFLFDETEISEWAYKYCLHIKDDSEVRKFITCSYWAYAYCKNINDDPEIRKNITDPIWAHLYCKYIKDYPEMRKIMEKVGMVINYDYFI